MGHNQKCETKDIKFQCMSEPMWLMERGGKKGVGAFSNHGVQCNLLCLHMFEEARIVISQLRDRHISILGSCYGRVFPEHLLTDRFEEIFCGSRHISCSGEFAISVMKSRTFIVLYA